ncbi:MAG: hypothetical protein JWQ09_5901 [Segetibacter sp.]|nr:hypothetical protein [Segetibacter sp.]
MIKKLLTIQLYQWYNLSNRPDKDLIIAEILKENAKTLFETKIERFVFSDDQSKFMRVPITLFDNLGLPGYKVEHRDLGHGKIATDLYFENQLIAIK